MDHPRITQIPGVMGGKPCIKGTRLPVEHVLSYLGAGDTIEDVLNSYPFVTREDVLAALTFAADYLKSDGLIPA